MKTTFTMNTKRTETTMWRFETRFTFEKEMRET